MSAVTTLKAVAVATDLLSMALELTQRFQVVSGLLAKARAEGREITEDELASVVATDDAARARLEKLIAGG